MTLILVGAIAALEDVDCPVNSLSGLKGIDKLAGQCGKLFRARQSPPEGPKDVYFCDTNAEPSSPNTVPLIEAALLFRAHLNEHRGKTAARQYRIHVCTPGDIEDRLKKVLEMNCIDYEAGTRVCAIDGKAHRFTSSDGKSHDFGLLVMEGRSAVPRAVAEANFPEYNNVFCIGNSVSNPRCAMMKDEIVKLVENVGAYYKLSLQNADKMKKSLEALNYMECGPHSALNLASDAREPSFMQWASYKMSQKMLI